MKKLILSVLTISLILISCNKSEEITKSDLSKYNDIETKTYYKLLEIGVSQNDIITLLDDVLIPNKILEIPIYPNYKRPKGFWQLQDEPGPGHNGPLADKCVSGGRDCKTGRNITHEITIEELDIFFNGIDNRVDIVNENGAYPEGHLYPEYLTIIYKDYE